MPSVQLVHPGWLWLLAAAGLPVLLAVWARRRGRLVPTPAVAAQALAVGLLALALAGPEAALSARARLPYLLVTDASASVRGQSSEAAEQLTKQFPPGWPVERFHFAQALTRGEPVVERGRDARDTNASNASPALRMIAARGGHAAAAVLATDGQFTDADWPSSAAAIATSGIPLLIVPMEHPPADGRLAAFSARRRNDGAVELSVTAIANEPMRRLVRVARQLPAGSPGWSDNLVLLPDQPAALIFVDPAPGDGVAVYKAALLSATGGANGDLISENDSATAMVLPARQRLLAVGDSATLRKLLGGIGLPVEYVGPEQLPSSQQLAGFAVIITADPDGMLLSATQRQAVAQAVRAGVGLVIVGTGPHQSPADVDDPLNQVAPLVANPFQRTPLHLVVVLDRSGSMKQVPPAGGQPGQRKFDLAAGAVVALKDQLTPKDSLDVIAFADKPEVIYQSGQGGPDFAALRAELDKVVPGGSTNVTPALAKALSLPTSARQRPMLLVVSDLETEPFDPEVWSITFKRVNAALAVVAIGQQDSAPPPLERLAEKVPGAVYQRREQFAGMAKLFASLVRRGRGEAIRAGRTELVIEGGMFAGGPKSLPPVDAYILSAKRGEVTLIARPAGEDPVVAAAPAGLGKAVSIALPMGPMPPAADGTPRPPLNQAWLARPEAAALVGSAARSVLRVAGDPRFAATLTRQGERLSVSVAAREDGRPMNKLKLSASVWTPSPAGAAGAASQGSAGAPAAVDLEQVAPGQYEGSLPAASDLPAAVAVRQVIDGGGSVVWEGTTSVLYPLEFARLGVNRENFDWLAELTGGRVLTADSVGPQLRQVRGQALTALWPWLLGLAILIMLGEWVFTRVNRR